MKERCSDTSGSLCSWFCALLNKINYIHIVVKALWNQKKKLKIEKWNFYFLVQRFSMRYDLFQLFIWLFLFVVKKSFRWFFSCQLVINSHKRLSTPSLNFRTILEYWIICARLGGKFVQNTNSISRHTTMVDTYFNQYCFSSDLFKKVFIINEQESRNLSYYAYMYCGEDRDQTFIKVKEMRNTQSTV